MAEPETPENQEVQENQESFQEESQNEEKKSSSGFPFWIIVAVVVAISAGAGLGVGRIFAKSKAQPASVDQVTPIEQKQQLEIEKLLTESSVEDSKSWYYPNLDPIVANLNEPGVNRYVRMSLIMEVSSAVNQSKGTAFLDEKKPLLVNYLTVYLSSLSIQDVRGDKNLNQIQSQIKDLLNEKLFPDAKPQITSVLFKEFSIQ